MFVSQLYIYKPQLIQKVDWLSVQQGAGPDLVFSSICDLVYSLFQCHKPNIRQHEYLQFVNYCKAIE